MQYTVLDIETTGLSKYYHKITEIAALKVKDKEIVDEFHTLINPKVLIPPFITRLTGIDNKMVKDAPSISKIMPHFIDFLKEDPMVAHNATFDHGFLSHNALQQGYKFANDRICTRRLASRLLPDLTSKRLHCVCDHLKIDNIQEHRAMGDALATHHIFLKMQDMIEKLEIKDVMKFQYSRH